MEENDVGSSRDHHKAATSTLGRTREAADSPSSSEAGETTDQRIVKAITAINRLPSIVDFQAEEAMALVIQKTKSSKQWIKNHENEFNKRVAVSAVAHCTDPTLC